MITCIIVEDEPLARNLLTEYVKKIPSLQLVAACSNAMEAMEKLRAAPVDLMFLDIQMPEITGLTLLKVLQKKPMIILTTAYSEYALESYEFNVIDYLLKPITLERFLIAVDKVNERYNHQHKTAPDNKADAAPYMFVKEGTRLVKVQLDDILYVEGLKDYVTIYTKEQKVIALQRLKTLETQLPSGRFIRIHNSYIVSLQAIKAIHKNEVQIGDTMLPIGDTYRKAFREIIEGKQMQ